MNESDIQLIKNKTAYDATTVDATTITSNSFILKNGTSAQFLKADGSVDPSVYLTDESLGSSLVKAIKGTSNQLNASSSAGVITLSLPDNVSVTNIISANRFEKAGGTSTQFLKADGSVDNSTYITEANLLKSINGTTNQVNAVSSAGAITLSLPENVSIGNSLTTSRITSMTTDAGILSASTTNLGSTTISSLNAAIASLGNASVSGSISANKIEKIGGTSTQFLKADGSTDNAKYITEEAFTANIVKSIKGTNNQIAANSTDGVITLSLPESVTIANNVSANKLISVSTEVGTLNASAATLGATTLTGGLTGSTANLSGALTALSFAKTGGTSSQFLKADGSVDPSVYLTDASLSESFVKSINGTTSQINAQASAGKITLSLPDAVSINGSVTVPTINATTTSAGTLTAGTTNLGITTASGSITAPSFVKSGGTGTQFLKADGSVDGNTYLTSSTLTSTLSNTYVTYTGAVDNIDLNSKNLTNISNLSASTTSAGTLTAGTTTLGITTATIFKTATGTSTQFLKADGSVDGNTYLTSSTLSSTLSNTFVPFTGAANDVNLNAKNITNAGTLSGTTVNAGILTAGTTSLGNTTATSFIKSGGTSSQYLRADGSVDNTVVTTSNASSTLSNTFELSSNVESGSYSATLTKTINISNSSDLIFAQATYTKIGNVVAVSIGFNVINTASGNTAFTVSLPITTTKSTQNYVGSIVVYNPSNGNAGTSGIVSITGTNIATIAFRAGSSTTYNGNATFTYTTQ